MERDRVWENIANKVSGESDRSDDAVVEDWVNQSRGRKGVIDRLFQIWQYNPKQIHDSSNIYRKFEHRKNQFGKRKRGVSFINYALRISAVLFFIIGSTFIINNIVDSNRDEVIIQEIYVAKGSRSTFNLPDGTKVWLSNNSTIRYPSKFIGKTRELEIEGEAYFEVTSNKSRPFIVNMGENRIRVLGTHFSVSAYPDDNEVRADLVEGKIQFEISNGKGGFYSHIVKPSHSLVLDKSSGKISDKRVPDGFYDYWLNGIYEFRNETLEDLSLKIDRIYNTNIIFEDESIKAKRFSGTISIDDNIFTFIEAIKSTSIEPLDYRYENRNLYIKLK